MEEELPLDKSTNLPFFIDSRDWFVVGLMREVFCFALQTAAHFTSPHLAHHYSLPCSTIEHNMRLIQRALFT